jgi:hypothetical protein
MMLWWFDGDPQQAGGKFNRTRRIESGDLFRGDGEEVSKVIVWCGWILE